MVFGVIGKFSAIFIAIPEPVLGGALICITGVFIGEYKTYCARHEKWQRFTVRKEAFILFKTGDRYF